MEQSDLKMKNLMERIGEVNSEPQYDARIKKLEVSGQNPHFCGLQCFIYMCPYLRKCVLKCPHDCSGGHTTHLRIFCVKSTLLCFQTHVRKIKRRGDAVFAYIRKFRSLEISHSQVWTRLWDVFGLIIITERNSWSCLIHG